MNTAVATKTFKIDNDFKYSPENGLKFKRHFTKEGVSPYDMFEYELRVSLIREPNGKIIFEMKEVEVPKQWSQVATDILAQKYFRKAGVPQYYADSTLKTNADGTPVLGPENSIKQVAHRLAGTWRYWSEKYGYFATAKDAQIFYEELVYMIINQMAAPNSPQWFNTGLHWAYGINGPSQGHYYIHPDTDELVKSEDSYTHPQPHACGRYNTKLSTDKGVMDLGYLVDENLTGTKVFDGENYVAVKAVKNNGVKKLYRATLKNGNYLEFTADHLVWSADKSKKDGGKYDWQELETLLGKRVQQVSKSATVLSDSADNAETKKAELAGWVLGDGYYGKYGRNKKTTMFGVITINDDEFNRVTSIFTELFGRYTVRPRRNVSDLYRIVCFDSKEVDGYVNEYDLNKNTHTAAVPEKIWQGSSSEKSAFLRGLFQADGCVRIKKYENYESGDAVLTTISEELAHGVQLLLLELGIYSRVSICRDSRIDRHECYQVAVAYESERKKYENLIGFVSEEKKQKLRLLNDLVDGKTKGAISEETIVSIDYIGEEEVYDIQTESGKFCANGVVVHNCFIQSVNDDLVNEGGIMDLWVREARLFKYGSGTGTNFSSLRGRGEPLSGGGTSSGLMSWLKIGDRAAGGIKSGGTTRRAAKMVILDVDHPDIEEFITWKTNEEKKVAAMVAGGYDSHYEGEAYQTVSGQNSNNSVRVSQEYLEAVETGADWNLRWRTGNKVCKTLPARSLWDEIASSAWACADPGLQFDTTINEWHTCPNSGRINASNPCCITGDTLIGVADGRNAVAIKDLVGQEVPVYTHDHATGQNVIGKMWNISVKRQNASVYKVTLDDGSSFRATDDHLIMTRDGSYVQVKDLKAGDSLMPFHSKVLAPEKSRTKRRFYWAGKSWKVQFRAVWNYINGIAPTGHHIHHVDHNALNDKLENLQLLTAEAHNAHHRDKMLGDNNPARRLMSDKWRKNIATALAGKNNPNYGKTHSVATRALMKVASALRWSDASERARSGRSIKLALARAKAAGVAIGRPANERMKRACPVCRHNFSTARAEQIFCSKVCRFSPLAIQMVGPKIWEKNRGRSPSAEMRAKLSASVSLASDPAVKQRAAFSAHRNRVLKTARLFLDRGLSVNIKNWDELCGRIFNRDSKRVPSSNLVGKLFSSDKQLTEQAELYNHKVVSVAFDGREDVYDGTVDKHHNFAILTSSEQSCVKNNLNYSGIFVHNSEYMFIDNTACNLASINLAHFYDSENSSFDVEGFQYATRLWTVVLEISVLMAQFPSKEIAQGSFDFRTLGLGYANIGSVLMTAGIPYDSPEALAFAGSVTSIMGAQSYITSAEMAKNLGPFPKYKDNRAEMLRVIRNHRRAAFNASDDEYESLAVKPVAISEEFAPAYLLVAARNLWNEALEMGERYGYRNAQTTLLAPTGTIGLVMDCSTTGVEPDFALVKFKKLSGGGYFKIVNESVPMALKTLGYSVTQITDIADYLKGHATLKNCPHINAASLQAKGFNAEDIAKVEKSLLGAFEMAFVFNVWTLGEECLKRLGFTSEQYNDTNFNLLKALGFNDEQVSEANEYVCGAMTIEGAPHLKSEHYAVFDTANKNGKKGQRYIHYLGHIRMMAAVQPFLCGSISKTINMPNEATVEDVKIAYMASWKLGLKCNAIYRDGCKLSQPLSAKSKKTESKTAEKAAVAAVVSPSFQGGGKGEVGVGVGATVAPAQHVLFANTVKQEVSADQAQITYSHDGTSNGKHIYIHGEQRAMPYKRSGITIKAKVAGQKIFLRTGEYPDGKLGEVFIDMYKEGASFRSLLNLLAISISTGLQYGVPLQEYVDKFTFTRFEPSGMTDHPNVKFCTSMIDFVFRVLGMEYLGRTDFVQVKPTGIQKNRAEQMAKLLEAAAGQKSMELPTVGDDDEIEKEKLILKEVAAPVASAPAVVSAAVAADVGKHLASLMGDAPPCGTCGHMTIRNGSCYKCLNCGSTTGCS